MPFCASCKYNSVPCIDTERFDLCYNVKDESGRRTKPLFQKVKGLKGNRSVHVQNRSKKKWKHLTNDQRMRIGFDHRPVKAIAEEYGVTEMAIRYTKKQQEKYKNA